MSLQGHWNRYQQTNRQEVPTRIELRYQERMSYEEATHLRVAVSSVPPIVPLRIAFVKLLHNATSLWTIVFHGRYRDSVCKNYGHTIAGKLLAGVEPKCSDCGKKIGSADEMRTALPKGH